MDRLKRKLRTDRKRAWVPGRILVTPRIGLPEKEFYSSLSRRCKGPSRKGRLKNADIHTIELRNGDDELTALERLKNDSSIKFAELDIAVPLDVDPDDPGYKDSYALPLIGAPDAWSHTDGAGITIAILDTGIDLNHPDLVDNIVDGFNVLDNNNDVKDDNGHGTKTAGVVAAVAGNKIGSLGIAPKSKIMPIKIAGSDGYALFSAMAEGLMWAADNGARIANLSYSGAAGSLTVQRAASYFRSKGGIVVVSAGNTGTRTPYPSHQALVVVSATDKSDRMASWSSYGPSVDLCAPGVSIYTTQKGGKYGKVSGTSFSAPIVAGSIALIMSKNPDLNPDKTEAVLYGNVKKLGTESEAEKFGRGRVDIGAAITAIVEKGKDTMPPEVTITSPVKGGVVSGTVFIDVEASGDREIARVELYIDDKFIGSDAQAPYKFAWESWGITYSAITIYAKAFDEAGNFSISDPVTVEVGNYSPEFEPEEPVVEPEKPSLPEPVITLIKKLISLLEKLFR